MVSKIKISSGFYIFLVLLILLLPVQWMAGAILAAVIHELFHILAVLFFGGEILSITVTGTGARIDATPMSLGKTLLSSLAGPTGSFLCLCGSEYFPEMALCGLVQGAYNLLPIYPLDGGRALQALCSEAPTRGIEITALIILSGISLWIGVNDPQFAMILMIYVWYPVIQRKNSCKDGNLAVQ
jgi:stage IV sporulation protein FB